jgi:hypothetical protein
MRWTPGALLTTAALVVLAAVVGGAACGAFVGTTIADVDGGAAPGAVDGGAGGGDGANNGGGGGGDDASTIDAATVFEGGVDPWLGDAGSSFCSKLSPRPTFCADFDEGVFPPAGTTSDVVDALAMLGGYVVSMPASFKATLTGDTTPHKSARFVVGPRTFPTRPSKVTIQFQLRLDATGAPGEAHFFVLEDSDGTAANPPKFGVRLSIDALSGVPIAVLDINNTHPRPTVGTVPLQTSNFFPVKVEVVDGKITFTLNGTASVVPVSGLVVPQTLLLKMGLESDAQATTIGAHYDDVVWDVTP